MRQRVCESRSEEVKVTPGDLKIFDGGVQLGKLDALFAERAVQVSQAGVQLGEAMLQCGDRAGLLFEQDEAFAEGVDVCVYRIEVSSDIGKAGVKRIDPGNVGEIQGAAVPDRQDEEREKQADDRAAYGREVGGQRLFASVPSP